MYSSLKYGLIVMYVKSFLLKKAERRESLLILLVPI